MMRTQTNQDVVTGLIRHCLENARERETLFKSLISEKEHCVELDGERIELSDEQIGEFVERFSAEVEPTLWESKRRKQ